MWMRKERAPFAVETRIARVSGSEALLLAPSPRRSIAAAGRLTPPGSVANSPRLSPGDASGQLGKFCGCGGASQFRQFSIYVRIGRGVLTYVSFNLKSEWF